MAVVWGIIRQELEKLENALHTTPGMNYPNYQDLLGALYKQGEYHQLINL